MPFLVWLALQTQVSTLKASKHSSYGKRLAHIVSMIFQKQKQASRKGGGQVGICVDVCVYIDTSIYRRAKKLPPPDSYGITFLHLTHEGGLLGEQSP